VRRLENDNIIVMDKLTKWDLLVLCQC
jgi:hypothetical protein